MEYLNYVWALLLVVVLLVGWALTLLTLPGNWLMVAAVAIYALAMPADSPTDISWPWIVVLVLLAALGELLEFLASAAGVKHGGGSKRGALLAIVGSFIGAIVGSLLGTAILPVIGTMIGVLLVAAVGALGGAMLGEAWKGRTLCQSWQVGQGAFWGRLAGSAGKLLVATLMVAVGALATVL